MRRRPTPPPPTPSFDEPLTPRKTVLRSAKFQERALELADTCAEIFTLGNRTALLELATLEYALKVLDVPPAGTDPRTLPSSEGPATKDLYVEAVEAFITTAESLVERLRDPASHYHASPRLVHELQAQAVASLVALAGVPTKGDAP